MLLFFKMHFCYNYLQICGGLCVSPMCEHAQMPHRMCGCLMRGHLVEVSPFHHVDPGDQTAGSQIWGTNSFKC